MLFLPLSKLDRLAFAFNHSSSFLSGSRVRSLLYPPTLTFLLAHLFTSAYFCRPLILEIVPHTRFSLSIFITLVPDIRCLCNDNCDCLPDSKTSKEYACNQMLQSTSSIQSRNCGVKYESIKVAPKANISVRSLCY